MQDAKQIVHEAEEFDSAPDKLFGICHAIGEQLGFNPFYLRVALIALMVFSPAATLATYAGLGALVLLSHILFPKPGSSLANTEDSRADEANVEPRLPLAA